MADFPKLALDTWLMGGAKEPDPDNDDAKDIAAIQLAIKSGVTLIDTAQNYANGRCEEIIGEALRDTPRDDYQILTKQSKLRLSYQEVLEDCRASMNRLRVDYLDYFLCHAPNPDFDMADFFKAANELYADGTVKNIGVSNFGPKMLKLAVETSDAPIVLNQVHVALDDDDVLMTGTHKFCVDHDITVQAYRTLVDLDKNQDAIAALKDVAQKRDLSVQQVAICYLNNYRNIAFTIRASSERHWKDIQEALGIRLDEHEIDTIRATHNDLRGNFRHFLEM